MDVKKEIKGLLKDLVEVAVTLAVILIVSKMLFGAKMLVPLVAVTSNSMLHTNDGWSTWLNARGVATDSFPLQNGFSQGDMILTVTPDGEGTILPIFSETQVGDVIIYNRDSLHRGNEPIIHRVVGIVHVEDWIVSGTEGTLDCLDESRFENEYIPYVRNCVSNEGGCPYVNPPEKGVNSLPIIGWVYPWFVPPAVMPEDGTFSFFITKGDKNNGPDQCGPGNGIALPVPDSQLTARGWIRIPYVGWLKLGLNKILGL